ncbi:MAG: hypothetical protein ABWY05_11275 [Noviherbaspirillum sp.]
MKPADRLAAATDPADPANEAVPPHYRGVWRRTLLETPDASDTGTTVFWLQASRWHADIRLPDGRPDFTGIDAFDKCGPAHIAWLARQQGFAGVTSVSVDGAGKEICQWRRIVDFQPPPATPDAGSMDFDGDALTETGIHARYLEEWRRLPDSIHGHAVLRLHEPQGGRSDATRLLLMAGQQVMHVRSRAAAWPAGLAPGVSLASLITPATTDLLDFEISFGRLGPSGWTVVRSTLPWLENTEVIVQVRPLGDSRIEIDFDGDMRCWDILEWSLPRLKGDWTGVIHSSYTNPKLSNAW